MRRWFRRGGPRRPARPVCPEQRTRAWIALGVFSARQLPLWLAEGGPGDPAAACRGCPACGRSRPGEAGETEETGEAEQTGEAGQPDPPN